MSLDIFKGWVLKDREDRFGGLPVPPVYRPCASSFLA